VYAAIFIGLLFEGEVILFTAFFLANEGYIDPYDTLFFVVMGVFAGDLLWYFMGPFVERVKFIQKIFSPVANRIDSQLAKRPALTILSTKFIYGFHRPTLLRARRAGINFWQFIKIDLVAATLWIAAIAGLATAFSASIALFKKTLRFAEISILLGVGVFVSGDYLISKFYRKRFSESAILAPVFFNS